MSQVPYTPLIDLNSPRGSTATLETVEMSRTNLNESTDHLCRICRNKLAKKQAVEHNPMECLSQRCELLETEVMKLKDHDVKSRIQIKDLELKVTSLEEAIQSLTAPKQTQAAPFNFSSGQKLRNPFKKAQSVDVPSVAASVGLDGEVNYDNILPLKRSGSRERVGLFGSLGASSQYR